ncbi:MAG: DegT/DnrJ/EryC1/StrS family aminotransferase, partial [Clostridia bacterium]
ANKIFSLRNFGLVGESVDYCGTNAKMNEFQAAMGICNLRHLTDEIEKREKIVVEYNKLLCGIDGVVTNIMQDKKNNFAYYPVLFDKTKYGMNRDEVAEMLKSHNIFARKYFYPATNEFKCYEYLLQSDNTPTAHYMSENILCLPIYADLLGEDIERICTIIKNKR